METIPFKADTKEEECAVVDGVAGYVPFTPPVVLKAIKTIGSKPPIIDSVAAGAPETAVYVVRDIKMACLLRLVGIDTEFDISTPLAMCRYVKPQGDNIYDHEICREADFDNVRREQHNTFLVDLFNLFMKENDCGVSAGKVTAPAAPPDCAKIRLEMIKKLTSDKLDTTKRSIEYLAAKGLYCGRDYTFNEAFDKANDVSYEEVIAKRKAAGRIRVRLEGKLPSWWDGESDTDSACTRVMWQRGKGHTFVTPEVTVVRRPTQLDLMVRDDIEAPPETLSVVIDSGTNNETNVFDTLKKVQE